MADVPEQLDSAFEDFGIAMLHSHHESEDELLYPLLEQRAPEQREMLAAAADQHQQVGSALDAVTSTCKVWRDAPSSQTGEELAASLQNLNAVLQPHLDDEEREVVPLAAVTLTQQEWDAVGEHSRAQSRAT